MAAVLQASGTTRGTADFAGTLGVDRLKRSFADEIFLLEANAMPLTTLARSMKKITVEAIKREWLEDEIVPEAVLMTETLTTGETSLAVDTGHGNYVGVDDLLWVTDLAFTERVMRVTAVTDSSTIVVERNEVGTADTITTGTVLLRLGNAMAQGSNTSQSKNTVEVLRTNSIQRVKKSFTLTKEATNVATYGDDPLSYQRRKSLLELMREIEYINFFGEGEAGDGLVENATAASRNPNIASGLYNFINDNAPSALKYDENGGALDETLFRNFIRDSYLNKGPHEPGMKVLFAAPSIISDLEGFHDANLQIKPVDTTGGVKVRQWQTSFGDINIVNHPLLSSPTGTSNKNWAFLVDLQDLAQVVQSNMDLEYVEINKENTTGQEVTVGEWKISQCLQVKGSAGVHGMIFEVLD